ncbi:hypothetical protein PgNI_10931 [Pyricularia grisea]|uniref:Uncharacterized protein n=1 Tax=Pyricularia grisea TaxID=148305 RepID=A0A6P8AZ05_PYRGI|nr:hypothetical protein PgNI_10931 [Pyricularia grisea]TLD07570.1 hypothetical protein PgNI_10931 [Pyricularia grisea]
MRTFSLLSILSCSSLLLDGAIAVGSANNAQPGLGGQFPSPGSARGAAAGVQVANHHDFNLPAAASGQSGMNGNVLTPASPMGAAQGQQNPGYNGPRAPERLYHGSRHPPRYIRCEQGGLRVAKQPEPGKAPMTYDEHVNTNLHYRIKGTAKTEFISVSDSPDVMKALLIKNYPSFFYTYIYYIDAKGIQDDFQNVDALYAADNRPNKWGKGEQEWITRKDIPWSAIRGWVKVYANGWHSDLQPNPTRWDPIPQKPARCK